MFKDKKDSSATWIDSIEAITKILQIIITIILHNDTMQDGAL